MADGAPAAADTAPARPLAAERRNVAAGVGTLYRVLRANPLTFVGFVLVVLLLGIGAVVALAPHLLVPYGATQQTGSYNLPPTIDRWPPNFSHPFGTDEVSHDMYSEVLLALPLDLGVGLLVAGVALLVGGLLGLVAGFWDEPGTAGGWTSVVILRTTDVFLAFPSLLLGLAVVAALGPGLWEVILAVIITWWPYYVRLVRGEVLAVKHLPYVTAARAAGVTDVRIVARHVVRNLLEPLVVYFTLDIGTVLVTFSTIAFVIPGAVTYPQPPEWGSMLSFFQLNYPFSSVWWDIAFPSLAIFVTALSFSLLGDGLRDVLDPRSRRALSQTGGVTGANPPTDTAGG